MSRIRTAATILGVAALLIVSFEMLRNGNEECPDTGLGFSAGACAAGLPDAALKAEAGAKDFPSASPPEEPPPIFAQKTAGSAERQCVEVGDDDVVRSGEFVAGNFRPFLRSWSNLQRGKLWWAPLHQERLNGLKIEAIPFDNDGKQHSYSFSDRASNSNGAFYPSVIRLPNAGVWRLVATSGPDWGCFDLALTANRDS